MVTILALLCFLAASNSAMAWNWGGQTNWTNGAADANWFTPGNWSGGVPGPNGLACIEPKTPGPVIDGDAHCSALTVPPWGWSGAPDISVDMNTGDFNCGDGIYLIAFADFDYGDNNTLGKGILNVFGGTVTTQNAGATGLNIGGGLSGYGNNYGRVNMYGGLISVPRIALYHGDIALYGGTLECTGPEANFVFFQNKPENKIDISGGTLKILGDSVTLFNSYIASRRIYSARGVLGEPVVVDGNTTLTSSDTNMIRAWNPSPDNNATNVHYRVGDVNVPITLSWNKGDYDYNVVDGREVNVIHKVYFGTSLTKITAATDVCAEYKAQI